MKDIMKIVKSLEDYGLYLKRVIETIKNEAKEQEGGYFSMLLGTLVTRLLGNMLACKGILRAGSGNKEREEIIRAGYGSERSSVK